MNKIMLVDVGEYREYGQIDGGLGLASVGLESIAAHLQNNGLNVQLVDQAMYGLTDQQVLEQMVQANPDIIGFNPLINSRRRVGELATRLKKFNPEIQIVIGGYDAAFLSLSHPLYHDVDIIVRGKGEIPMFELAQGEKLDQIKGISFRDRGEVVENLEERALSLSPEELPPIPLRQNLEYLAKTNEPVSIYASYGCYYNCTFCSTSAFYPHQRRTERNLEHVLTEIDFLADNKITRFSFYDEDFFGLSRRSLDRATTIIQKVKDRKGTITFSFITTLGIHHAEQFGLLKGWEGTVNRLYVGVEGGCDQALERLGNASCRNSSQNLEAIEIIRKYNLGLQIGFIMFNPYSDFEELTASAEFLYEHNEAVNATSFFHHLRPYKGTKMYNQLNGEGLLIEEEALSEIDLHSGLPYHFKVDLASGNEKMKTFAKAICPTSGEEAVSKSDRLNNEIYMRLVSLGYGREVFAGSGPKVVSEYQRLRKAVSDLNYVFFNDSLIIFRDYQGTGFEEKKGRYLRQLADYVSELEIIQIKLSG